MSNNYNRSTEDDTVVTPGDLMADTQRLSLTVDKDQVRALKLLAAEMDTQVSIIVRGLLTHGLDGLVDEDEEITAAVEQAVYDERVRRSEVGKRGMESRWGSSN